MDTEHKVKRFILMGGLIYYASGGFRDYINSFDTREEADAAMKAYLEENDSYHWAHVGDTITGDYWGNGKACNPMGALS